MSLGIENIHRSNQEQTRVWEVMTACKAAILFPRLYTKLLTIWGRELPLSSFVFLSVFKEFFALPRLRKALSIVLNKRRNSPQRISSSPKPGGSTISCIVEKNEAEAKLRTEAASNKQ